MTNFGFNPVTGLSDTNTFPQKPGATAARQQFMTLFNQIRDWINGTLLNGNGTITADNATAGSNLADGWTLISQVLTYATADAPTFTATTSADLTPFISVGMRIMLTNTTVKYFIVTAITSSTITLYGGTDYALTNVAISAVYYSPHKAPFGFPLDPNKWKIRVVDNTGYTLSGPGVGTYYNPGSLKATLPIGSWTLSGQFQMYVSGSAGVIYTISGALSTSASSVSDTDLVDFGTLIDVATAKFLRIKTLTIATKTIYYLILGVIYGTPTSISIPLSSNTVLEAVCAYL
jgi:hypothetical protein